MNEIVARNNDNSNNNNSDNNNNNNTATTNNININNNNNININNNKTKNEEVDDPIFDDENNNNNNNNISSGEDSDESDDDSDDDDDEVGFDDDDALNNNINFDIQKFYDNSAVEPPTVLDEREERLKRLNVRKRPEGPPPLDWIEIDHPVIPRNMTRQEYIMKKLDKSYRSYRMNLSRIDLFVAPPEAFSASTLRSLLLHNNQISQVPGLLSRLPHLLYLNLSFNRLTALPKAIGSVSRLEILAINNNQIGPTLPKEMGNLEKLVRFDLRENRITRFPWEMGRIPASCVFFAQGNSLDTHPEEIVGDWVWQPTIHRYLWEFLESQSTLSLNASEMNLGSIPKDVQKATHLTSLDLTGNQLSSLAELVALTRLKVLRCEKNPDIHILPKILTGMQLERIDVDAQRITSPPPEILRLGTDAILRFMRAILVLPDTFVLSLQQLNLDSMPWEYPDAMHMRTVLLDQNLIKSLHPRICECAKLQVLSLNHNKFEDVPQEIAQLPALTGLSLRGNRITVIPLWLCGLSQLKSLRLGANNIDTVPFEFVSLVQLLELDLLPNPFQSPLLDVARQKDISVLFRYLDMFGLTGDKTVLDVAGMEMDRFPKEVAFSRIQVLRMGSNPMAEIDPRIRHSKQLRILDASVCKLMSLPMQIGKLIRMVELNLSDNRIRIFPNQICSLTNLVNLNFANNSLSDLSDDIGNLVHLEQFRLEHNRISVLPTCIGQLKSLQIFELSHNPISILPPEIGGCTSLTSFRLNSSGLTLIPPEIAKLSFLTELDVRQTKVNVLPPSLGLLFSTLTNLKFNDIVHMKRPPEKILEEGILATLTYLFSQHTANTEGLLDLRLTKNQSWNLSIVEDIAAFPDLRILRIDNIKLQQFPDQICLLEKLTELSVSHNQVKMVPRSLRMLMNLKYFDLSTNYIADMPRCLASMHDLRLLDLSNNRLWSFFGSAPTSEKRGGNGGTRLVHPGLRQAALGEAYESGDVVGQTLWNIARKRLPVLVEHRVTTRRHEREHMSLMSCDKLESLWLSGNHISEIPSSISVFTSLTSLRLENNRFSTMHVEMAKLTALRELNMGNNRLTVIFPQICSLTSLTTLILDTNELNRIPDEMALLTRLSTLNLRDNRIHMLPELVLIALETSLTFLDLAKNPIEDPPPDVVEDGGTALFTHLHNTRRARIKGIFQVTGAHVDRLTLDVRKLSCLTELTISETRIRILPDVLSALVLLREVSIPRNEIESIPESFRALTAIRHLDLSSNRLVELPAAIGYLTNLRKLRAEENELCKIDSNLTSLRKLRQLYLSHNELSEIPRGSGWLLSCKKLYLSHNQLSIYPPSLAFAKKLRRLDLSFNRIGVVPDSMGNLASIEELLLQHNLLESVPETIGYLTTLQLLDISINSINTLPRTIWYLTRLTELNIRQNAMVTLPKEICHLASLQSLDCTENPFLKIPDGMHLLSSLSGLMVNPVHVESTRFSESTQKSMTVVPVEPQVVPLRKLQMNETKPITFASSYLHRLLKSITVRKLDLSSMGLVEIPLELFDMTQLTSLDLHSNSIDDINPALCIMTTLLDLNVSSNRLVELPENFGTLSFLEKLKCAQNELLDLPSSFTQLSRLQVLDMGSNVFDKMPMELVFLPSLTHLDAGSNKYYDMGLEYSRLTSVQNLRLASTKLTTIPECVCFMENLQFLDCGCCRLTTVPPSVGKLTRLKTLCVQNNMLRQLPIELSSLCNLQILDAGSNVIVSIHGKMVRGMTCLREIAMSANNLVAIPDEISELKQLTHLDLRQNNIQSLNPSLGALWCFSPNSATFRSRKYHSSSSASVIVAIGGGCLRDFRFEGNPVSFPPGDVLIRPMDQIFDFLEKFRVARDDTNSLELCSMRISFVMVPASLVQLKHLILNDNRLVRLPLNLDSLVHLEIIRASKNFLPTVPDCIVGLTLLQELDISSNAIVFVPRILRKGLSKGSLTRLNVADNPLKFTKAPDGWIEGIDQVTKFLSFESYHQVLNICVFGPPVLPTMRFMFRMWRWVALTTIFSKARIDKEMKAEGKLTRGYYVYGDD